MNKSIQRILFTIFLYTLFHLSLVGCGGGGPSVSTKPPGPANVVFLSTSTANDQLNQFYLHLESISLVDANGQIAPVRNFPPEYFSTEWIHVNGNPEPLFTASLPQGTYTGVQISIATGSISCFSLDSNGNPALNFWQLGNNQTVTSNFQQPVIISGNSLGILINLLVSKSTALPECNTNLAQNPPFTPTFSVTPIDISSLPTGAPSLEMSEMEGVIASVNAQDSTFTVSSVEGWGSAPYGIRPDPPDGPSWTLSTNSSTSFQGISDFSQLAVGMAVDIDATIQQDGTLNASRVAVYDTQTENTSLWNGPIVRNFNAPLPGVTGGSTAMDIFGTEEIAGPVQGSGALAFDYGTSTFNTSKQFSNLSNLPFPTNFNISNVVEGQNVAITMHNPYFPPSNVLPTLNSLTLIPQTLNGTISSIGSDGNFTTYTITLAPYNTFPLLATLPGQTTLLTNPSQVVVYADSNTQMLNSSPVAVGNVMRFYGLVFNDSGTLRMDCAKILDGVPE